MIKHSLLLIYRNFKRFKNTFFINLIGLSTGLTCTVLIYLWVKDEWAVDNFHEKSERLYHVIENRVKSEGIWTSTTTSGPLGETITQDMPEVEAAVNLTSSNRSILTVGERSVQVEGGFAGKDFFKMFSFPLLQGDVGQVLNDKNSIVISDALAVQLFNSTENVVGKSIQYDHDASYLVTGVYKKMPVNSSLQLEYVIPFEKFKDNNEWVREWGNTGTFGYVLLKEGADVKAFNAKFADYISKKTEKKITHRTPFLSRFRDVYLYGKYENGVQAGGRITYVKLFSIIAIFILVIACINFMNLSTAKASRRIKEVGIKKAVGAGRNVLVMQYLGESMLMSLLSLLLAVLLVDLLLPQFNIITAKHIALHFDAALIFSLLGIALFAGLLAGSYPAIYLSGFNPALVLKGKMVPSLGEQWARTGLVVFQFSISIIFIVSVMVVYKQIEYVQAKDLGYNKDNIIAITRTGALYNDNTLETFLTEVKNVRGVINASSIGHNLMGHNSGTYGVEWPTRNPDDKSEFENMTVNYGMMETMGITMAEGRMFSKNFNDTARIIFNEAAIRFMGLQNPIGQTIKLWGNPMEIIGVAKDFNFESLHVNVKPLFLRIEPGGTWNVMIKVDAAKEKEVLKALEAIHQRINPGFTFEFEFVDEGHQRLYASEQRVATLSKYFAGLAILISCLGLFGLVTFTAERRVKEIGIRKVLGSSVAGIVMLLSKDFTKIVLTSVVIALPLSFFLVHTWLQGFAYRTPLSVWYFVLAGVVVFLIAWITVGVQAVKAARVNPTRCLKEQ